MKIFAKISALQEFEKNFIKLLLLLDGEILYKLKTFKKSR